MSIQMNQYLGYGYLLDYKVAEKALEAKYSESEIVDIFDKYHDSSFNNKIVEVNGFSMISDGMSGKYNFFGKIFQKSAVYEPLDTTIMPKITSELKYALRDEFIKVFGDSLIAQANITLITHYS